MRIVSWNVNGRTQQAQARQLAALLEREPDVVALQEVTHGSYESWRRGLSEAGLSVLSTLDLVALPYPPPENGAYPSPPFPPGFTKHVKRKNFNLLAHRGAIDLLPGLQFKDPAEAQLAFPEKHLAGRLLLDGTAVEVHNTHLPPGVSRGMVKVHHFEAIRQRIDESRGTPRILCGDFNAPISEDVDGPVIQTWGSWPKGPDSERWIKAEVAALANPQMRDVYRALHVGATEFPASHHTGPSRTPHRYDFIFASEELKPTRCRYLTDWLEATDERSRLSDHAAVEADLGLA
jgi:endonuclease/exonuclease/phosphatase family metal-dependent hydrolase